MSDVQLEEGQYQQQCQQNQSSEYIQVKSAGRTDICGICRSSLSRYTCPKCKQKTCSLNCNKKHKQLKMCCGIRNTNEFISFSQYKQQNAQKDFQFVKQIINKTDKVKKCLTGVTTPFLQPKRFQILRFNAKKLHNITLYHAPAIIQRHRENISFYFMKTKEIYWVFELMFFRKLNAKNKKQSYQWIKSITLPSSDTLSFTELINKNNFLSPVLLQENINSLKTQQFTIYIQNKQFLNCEQPPIYHKFKSQDKICNCLKNIKIYQFPSLMIVHTSLIKLFEQQFNI